MTPTQKTDEVFEPFETVFLARRNEVMSMINVYGFAMRSMSGIAKLSEVLKKPQKHIDQVRELETKATEEVDLDFPLLHSAGIMLIWGALETSVRDFLVCWLLKHPKARRVEELSKLRIKVGDYESLEDSDRMRLLIDLLERELGSSLKFGVGRFTSVLKPFGIAPRVSDECRNRIHEMAAIRNVIAHKAGVIDAKFVTLCPSWNAKLGQQIRISSEALVDYVNAAGNFAAAIVVAASEVQEEIFKADG